MKKNFFKKIMLLSMMGMFMAGTMTFVSCGSDDPDDPNTPPVVPGGGDNGGNNGGNNGGGNGGDNGGGKGGDNGGNNGGGTSNDPWANLVNEDVKTFSASGNWAKYGDHEYIVGMEVNAKGGNFIARKVNTTNGGWSAFDFDENNSIASNYVTFTNIPSGFTEFKTVYEKFLGFYPEGCIAMVPMAMEIYARDHATGEKCLRLLCRSNYATNALNQFKTTYGKNTDCRFLAAAALQGANAENAYTPDYPYRVNVRAWLDTEDSSVAEALIMHNQVETSGGWSNSGRHVDVHRLDIQTSGPYKIGAFSDLYLKPSTRLKGKTWQGLK